MLQRVLQLLSFSMLVLLLLSSLHINTCSTVLSPAYSFVQFFFLNIPHTQILAGTCWHTSKLLLPPSIAGARSARVLTLHALRACMHCAAIPLLPFLAGQRNPTASA
jgi:hypothetical protein